MVCGNSERDVLFSSFFWHIKMSKCPYVTSLKVAYFCSFLHFLSQSQRNHKIQLHLITLYLFRLRCEQQEPKAVLILDIISGTTKSISPVTTLILSVNKNIAWNIACCSMRGKASENLKDEAGSNGPSFGMLGSNEHVQLWQPPCFKVTIFRYVKVLWNKICVSPSCLETSHNSTWICFLAEYESYFQASHCRRIASSAWAGR